jgi:lipopolysaccharide export system ATP-binding protein
VLKATGLRKEFSKRHVVDDVSFQVNEGEVVGLLGPNGAGKTTSFYMVVGLIKPDIGSITLNGEDITTLPMYKRAKKGIAYLPQNTSVFKKMSVEDNLLAVMEITEYPAAKRKDFLEELLAKFQINHIRKSLGMSLSGGERRRVEIARALVSKPQFILLDEPFAGVDPVTVQEIQKIVEVLKDSGMGVLITDHNFRETLGSCQRTYVLSKGKVIAHGTKEEIYSSEIVRKSYLGENFLT